MKTYTCCGLPMRTLELFGLRLYKCFYRSQHPMIFRNLSTGEELTERYHDDDPDDALSWTSHYGED